MALLVGGEVEAAERAYAWVPTHAARRRLVADEDRRRRGRGRAAARPTCRRYLAVGRLAPLAGPPRPRRSSRGCWPAVRAALDWVVAHAAAVRRHRLVAGVADGRPGRVNEDALLAGSSSIYQSLRAGVALAELLDEPQPEWELAGGRLGHALREHRDLFLDKSTFSMDWYYPVLGGAVRGEAGARPARRRAGTTSWCPGLGHPLRRHQPVGDRRRDLRAGDGAGRARRPRPRAASCSPTCSTCAHEDGGYWTGYVYPDDVIWPAEHTTYTAAAVILAADALSRDGTPGAPGSCAATTLVAALRASSRSSAAAPSADGVAGRRLRVRA